MPKNNAPFERKSYFNQERNSYLDSDFNYVYTYDELQPNGTYITKKYIIPYSSENRDVFIFLDDDDHSNDLSERYKNENTVCKVDGNFDIDPIENILDNNSDFTREIIPVTEDPLITKIAEWIETLPESQRNLIYEHFGEGKFLEDIRREEEQLTGKKITKQAMYNRWNKIITKACKHFNVEKPKQKHSK